MDSAYQDCKATEMMQQHSDSCIGMLTLMQHGLVRRARYSHEETAVGSWLYPDAFLTSDR